ncbi:Hypothetical protein LOCK900_2406 [Lacticaseibacillus rhamnosus LOCK900]|nr:Hypothetical protein LOCK900_2406 [Lacticaseibacillus rhamnosus LOCK900]ASY48362.1 hypothetical protein N507_1178 [Lacticaseibacillus rhamnosus DSM 14870]
MAPTIVKQITVINSHFRNTIPPRSNCSQPFFIKFIQPQA